MFLALMRLAGLRRSEALNVRWQDVDWETHRLTVLAGKTGKWRVVAVGRALYHELLARCAGAHEGEALVVTPTCVSRSSMARRFKNTIKSAGLLRWRSLFHVLRKNRATDWAGVFPQQVASQWMDGS